MPEIKLKPCPFCGGEAITDISVTRGNIIDSIGFDVYCTSCKARQHSGIAAGVSFESLESAMNKTIEAWNRRTTHETIHDQKQILRNASERQ